jgi:AsmA protein
MTTEGQGRTAEPVGFGIPVIIDGPWAQPRIYPEMSGILENPDQAYAKLKEMGKGLFGPNGAGLGAALGGLLGGAQPGAGQTPGQPGQPGQLGGNLGETLGNLLQQGLGGLNASPSQTPSQAPPPRTSSTREIRGRSIPSTGAPQDAPPPPAQAAPQAAPAPAQNEPPQDSQAMNEVLRQLFNR